VGSQDISLLISVSFPFMAWKKRSGLPAVRVKGAVRRYDALDALPAIDDGAVGRDRSVSNSSELIDFAASLAAWIGNQTKLQV
jgi:hypothetical protein